LRHRDDWEHAFQYGVTGNLCRELVIESRAAVEGDPRSIYAFSVWKAILEIARRFEDEQGIPVDEVETIDSIVLDPLKRFLESGGLLTETPSTRDRLSDILLALAELRVAISLPSS
jgi:hypothetical protein